MALPLVQDQEALITSYNPHTCLLLLKVTLTLSGACCRVKAGSEQLLACWCWVVTYHAVLAGITAETQGTADQMCSIKYGEHLCNTVERPCDRLAG